MALPELNRQLNSVHINRIRQTNALDSYGCLLAQALGVSSGSF